jgi:hypothetical protein
MTLSINNTQHNNSLALWRMLLCWVPRFVYCYAECHYAECCYAECCGALLGGYDHRLKRSSLLMICLLYKRFHWPLGNKGFAINLPSSLAKWMVYLLSKGLWCTQEGGKPICILPYGDLRLIRKYDTKELLLERKAQYSWPPCTNSLRSASLEIPNILYFFTQQPTLVMR